MFSTELAIANDLAMLSISDRHPGQHVAAAFSPQRAWHRLPRDVFVRIFCFVVDISQEDTTAVVTGTPYPQYSTPGIAPLPSVQLTLRLVCKDWDNAVLHTPYLWRHLPPVPNDFGAGHILGEDEVSRAIRWTYKTFLSHLKRSGTLLLQLRTRIPPLNTAEIQQYCTLLEQAAPRLGHLDLTFNPISLGHFSQALFPFHNLRTARITLDMVNQTQLAVTPSPTNLFFTDAPGLSFLKVEVLGASNLKGLDNFSHFYHSFANLTRLAVHGLCSMMFHDILWSTPNLVWFEFVNSFGRETLEIQKTCIHRILSEGITHLQHPNLQNLRVSSSDSGTLLYLWKRALSFPNLRTLKFHDLAQRNPNTAMSDQHMDGSLWAEVFSKTLTLVHASISCNSGLQELMNALNDPHALPSLHSLVIVDYPAQHFSQGDAYAMDHTAYHRCLDERRICLQLRIFFSINPSVDVEDLIYRLNVQWQCDPPSRCPTFQQIYPHIFWANAKMHEIHEILRNSGQHHITHEAATQLWTDFHQCVNNLLWVVKAAWNDPPFIDFPGAYLDIGLLYAGEGRPPYTFLDCLNRIMSVVARPCDDLVKLYRNWTEMYEDHQGIPRWVRMTQGTSSSYLGFAYSPHGSMECYGGLDRPNGDERDGSWVSR